MPPTKLQGWPSGSSILILVASVWLLSGPVFGHMGPPWPCLLAGASLALCAFMLYRKPESRLGWGTLATCIAGLTLFLGAGAIIPALIGIVGGVSAAMWKPKNVPQ